jgi:hypothetical protein
LHPLDLKIDDRRSLSAAVKDIRRYAVISPDGIPSQPEPLVGIEDARKEKAAFVERYKTQGYYAAVGQRIPWEELERHVRIEPWGEFHAEPQ